MHLGLGMRSLRGGPRPTGGEADGVTIWLFHVLILCVGNEAQEMTTGLAGPSDYLLSMPTPVVKGVRS